jgi:hypothetical protein
MSKLHFLSFRLRSARYSLNVFNDHFFVLLNSLGFSSPSLVLCLFIE